MDSYTGRPVSHERWRLGAQWFGIISGPVIFLGLLQTQYVLGYVACETRKTWFLHAATVLALLIVGAGGLFAWRAASENPLKLEHPATPERTSLATTDEVRRQRSTWMSVLAAGLCVLFILLILALEIPILMLQECQ
jgi:hypothetical protein